MLTNQRVYEQGQRGPWAELLRLPQGVRDLTSAAILSTHPQQVRRRTAETSQDLHTQGQTSAWIQPHPQESRRSQLQKSQGSGKLPRRFRKHEKFRKKRDQRRPTKIEKLDLSSRAELELPGLSLKERGRGTAGAIRADQRMATGRLIPESCDASGKLAGNPALSQKINAGDASPLDTQRMYPARPGYASAIHKLQGAWEPSGIKSGNGCETLIVAFPTVAEAEASVARKNFLLAFLK